MSLIPLLVSVFGNLWLWRIAELSLVHFVVYLAVALSLVVYLAKPKKPALYFFLASFAASLLLGIVSFKPINLTELSNDEIRVRDERLSMYPRENLQLGYYYEQKTEVVATQRILRSIFEELDPNIYFFAGHPRERLGVVEFEKFPYILLPVFLIGVYYAIKNKKLILGLFIIPFLLNSLNQNTQSDYGLLPFMAVAIYLGLVQSIKLVKNYKHKKFIYALFIFCYLLLMIQIISYEIS